MSGAPRTDQPARAPMAVTSRRWAGSSSISNRQRVGSGRIDSPSQEPKPLRKGSKGRINRAPGSRVFGGLGGPCSLVTEAPRNRTSRKGSRMAAELDLEKETAVHAQGYSRFVALLKWGTIAAAVITALVVLIIAN
ncbi:aa3-type cytochrome c oxidase subunit IV [Sphingomonas parva]|uniref:Aa3-type cytochrome c oxidase subunit IV n=1 Tax=Sphingomonas parva TaxID=2555898 RepID=A0A4Y8ZKR7_9SPHN|nr:aa3-type cytochrome c oxidase subunit IV [Sphingomonas parva]